MGTWTATPDRRFANGMVVRERILDIDESSRRVAYTALDGPGMSYHHASMQIVEGGQGRCRFVWITDFLPAELKGTLAPLIELGIGGTQSQSRAIVTVASDRECARARDPFAAS